MGSPSQTVSPGGLDSSEEAVHLHIYQCFIEFDSYGPSCFKSFSHMSEKHSQSSFGIKINTIFVIHWSREAQRSCAICSRFQNSVLEPRPKPSEDCPLDQHAIHLLETCPWIWGSSCDGGGSRGQSAWP